MAYMLSHAKPAVRPAMLGLCAVFVLIGLFRPTLAAAAAATAAAAAAAAGEVGDLGDPAALRFEGVTAYTPDEIRDELQSDMNVQVASAPTAPLADYLALIEKQLALGFKNGGFPEAKVDVSADRGNGAVMVKVAEGPRYLGGAVKVTGGKTLPKDKLVALLTTARVPGMFTGTLNADDSVRIVPNNTPEGSPSTVWVAGAPVPFDDQSRTGFYESVRRRLCELGYFRARFTVHLVPADAGKADLAVRVEDEGPRAVLARVELKGLAKHTPEQVLEYAGLSEGRPVNLEALESAQRRLWESARFKKQVLDARPRAGDPSKIEVTLDLEEYEPAPPLGEPFTPVEQAALRLRQWLLDFAAGRAVDAGGAAAEDLWFDAGDDDNDIQFALSPRAGFALRVRVTADPAGGEEGLLPALAEMAAAAGHTEPVAVDVAMVATDKLAGLYAPGLGGKLVGEGTSGVSAEVNLTYAPKLDESGEAKWTLNVGAGMKTHGKKRRGTGESPVKVNFVLAPVAFLDMVHEPKNKVALRDGVLELDVSRLRLRSDAATGRLLEISIDPEALAAADGGAKPKDGRARLHGGTGAGKLAERVAAIEKLVPGPNALDPKRPAGSTLSYAISTLFRGPGHLFLNPDATAEQRLRAADAASRLFTPEAFAPLEDVVAGRDDGPDHDADDGGEDTHKEFDIPIDFRSLRPQGLQGMLAMLVLPRVNDVFPRGSWPWTVSREMLLVLAGKPSESAAETSRIFTSPDTGPVGFLACAGLLSYADEKMAATFARRGLRRLTADDFAKDARALLGGESATAGILKNLAANLRKLDDADVDALAAVLPPASAPGFRKLAAALRADADESLDEALRHLWDGSLKQAVEAELHRLAGE
jgi:hypothetical protein